MDPRELPDEELWLQMQDDLYDGMKEEVAAETNEALSRGYTPAEVLDSPEVVRSYLGDVAVAAQRSGPAGGSIGAPTDEPEGDHP